MSKKRGVSVLAVAVTAVLGIFVMQRTLAATGTIFLSPSSVSVKKGASFTVDVRINPGAATDGVEATIAYDQAKLQFVSISASGTAYPIELTNTGGGGTVQIARGKLGGTVSANNSLVAKVAFKALAGSGSGALNLSGNSTSGGVYNDPTASDATVAFSTPTVPTPPTQPTPPKPTNPTPLDPEPTQPSTGGGTSTPSTGGSSSGGSTPSKPSSTTPPTTTEGVRVTILKTSFREVNFGLTGPQPFTAYIKYGMDGKLNVTTPTTKLAKKHTIKLDKKLLIPGTTYSYRVVTKNKAGKTTQTETAAVKTKGYTVRVTVKGKGGKLLKNQLVTLHSEPMTARTDENGVATFQDVAPGKHELEYEQDGEAMGQTIEVADDAMIAGSEVHAEPQSFAVTFENATSGSSWAMIIALVGFLVLIGAGVLLFRSGKLVSSKNRPGGPSVGAGGVGTGGMTIGGGMPGSPPATPTDDLLSKVPGEHNADPGSVISPNGEDKK
jgi:hypothetical protein